MRPIFLFFLMSVAMVQSACAPVYYRGPVSDHFDGKHFFNPGKPMDKGFWQLLRWRWTRKPEPWPDYQALAATDHPPQRVTGAQLRVSFVGQATVLLQTQGLNILTDPLWSERASPVSWLGPKRVHPPGIALADVPPVDLILISHNHYDHLDLQTLALLVQRDNPLLLTALGNESLIFAHIPRARVISRDWGDSLLITDKLTVHLAPMQHWSARTPFDRNRALWAAFILATPGGKIYFCGDSGYGAGENFRAAAAQHGPFRLALLPIGSSDPQWFMSYGHMNPQEAVQAFADLGHPYMVPTHIQTIQLADTGYAQPLRALQVATAENPVAQKRIHPLAIGQHWWVPQR